MPNIATIGLEELRNKLDLAIINDGGKSNLTIKSINMNCPGLQLIGYYEYFDSDRIQILGDVEINYMLSLDEKVLRAALDRLFSYSIPCVVICGEVAVPPVLVAAAKDSGIAVLKSSCESSVTMSRLSAYLDDLLAARTIIHGELLDLYGVGVLVLGNSGVGKSETALELVGRGHRLVADDAVEIRKLRDGIVGRAPEMIRHFMEVRGIGIIDIQAMYGSGAIKLEQPIELVVKLENFDEDRDYDHMGRDYDYETIMGVEIPSITIPIKPGRNVAVLMEVAARNFRLKMMGYSAAEQLERRCVR